MNNFRVAIVLILLTLISLACNSEASIQNNEVNTIKIRAWNHVNYLRIVLEGADEVISTGKVSQNQGEIEVVFERSGINVEKRELPFSFTSEENLLKIALEKPGEIKTFSLKNPSRIVIDVYDQKQKSAGKVKKSKKAVKRVNNKD